MQELPFSLEEVLEYLSLAGGTVINDELIEVEIFTIDDLSFLRFLLNKEKQIIQTKWINEHGIESIYWFTQYDKKGRRQKETVLSNVYKKMEMYIHYSYSAKGVEEDITNGHGLYHDLAEAVVKMQKKLQLL